MSTDIQIELNEVIKKNLPQAMGEVLRKRLEQADKDAADVAKLTESSDRLQVAYRNLSDQLQAAEEKLKIHKTLDDRHAELNSRELRLDMAILQIKLDEMTKSRDFAASVTMGLVKNTEFRKTVFESGSEHIPVPGNPGGNGVYASPGYAAQVPVNKTTVTTENKE